MRGTVACRISIGGNWNLIDGGWGNYYCDYCGKYFEEREKPPCENKEVKVITRQEVQEGLYNG
jgi:hypothetical protein